MYTFPKNIQLNLKTEKVARSILKNDDRKLNEVGNLGTSITYTIFQDVNVEVMKQKEKGMFNYKLTQTQKDPCIDIDKINV